MLRNNRIHFSAQAGFTLLELMVVVSIIGIVISFAGISLGQQGDERLETEAKRIHQLIKMASDEAIMQSREYALRFAVSDYLFLNLDPNQGGFVPLEADKMFRRRELDPDYHLTLEIEGQEVELVEKSMGKDKTADEIAQAQDQSAQQPGAGNQPVKTFEPVYEDDKKPVDIFILSSGEVTPFKLTLSFSDDADQGEYVVEGSFSGDIAYKPPNSNQDEEDSAWTF